MAAVSRAGLAGGQVQHARAGSAGWKEPARPGGDDSHWIPLSDLSWVNTVGRGLPASEADEEADESASYVVKGIRCCEEVRGVRAKMESSPVNYLRQLLEEDPP